MKKAPRSQAVKTPRRAAVERHALDFASGWDYAPALETVKPGLREEYGMFVGGRWCRAADGGETEIINPATERVLTRVAAGGAEDVDRAVKVARGAYEKVWSKMPGRERGKYLYRIARLLQERARELAVLETMNGG